MMRTGKIIVALAAAFAAAVGQAEDSAPFPLDTMEGPRVAREVEPITYSPHWNGAASCTVDLGGAQFTATDEGVTTWLRPIAYGLYTLTHTAGGETLTAQFVVPDPIPEIGGDGDVAGALAGSADGRLGKHVKTAAAYNAYRGWADANGLDHGTVKGSPRAWFSYALDASNLVERAFQDGDVAIVSLETASDGTFTFEVDVKDVLIGSSATAANLATVFEVQGAPSLAEDAFSPAKVRATLGVSANSRLTVAVTPKAAHATFFVRVRLHTDDDGWTGDAHGKVQLWAGGPYWAETNVGADEPWEYGYYFWWGDVVGYRRENDAWVASDGSSSGFAFSEENTPTCGYGKTTSTLQGEGWITADGVLAPEHDAAQVQWGGGWRMPTVHELSDLCNNCDWTWTTTNGVNGYVVRGRGDYASASIFLPAAGYGRGTSLNLAGSYGIDWSSVPYSRSSYDTRYLYFDSGDHNTNLGFRYCGQSVRPVQGFTE